MINTIHFFMLTSCHVVLDATDAGIYFFFIFIVFYAYSVYVIQNPMQQSYSFRVNNNNEL